MENPGQNRPKQASKHVKAPQLLVRFSHEEKTDGEKSQSNTFQFVRVGQNNTRPLKKSEIWIAKDWDNFEKQEQCECTVCLAGLEEGLSRDWFWECKCITQAGPHWDPHSHLRAEDIHSQVKISPTTLFSSSWGQHCPESIFQVLPLYSKQISFFMGINWADPLGVMLSPSSAHKDSPYNYFIIHMFKHCSFSNSMSTHQGLGVTLSKGPRNTYLCELPTKLPSLAF